MKNIFKNIDTKSLILIIGLALFDIFGQFCFKQKQKIKNEDNKSLFVTLGFISYLLYAYCVYQLVTTKKLSTTGVLHTLSHFIVLGVLFALGKFYFNEKYNSNEILGLFLGIISIYILLNESHDHGHDHGENGNHLH